MTFPDLTFANKNRLDFTKSIKTTLDVDFLLQEDGSFLLQEDGDKLIISSGNISITEADKNRLDFTNKSK